MRVKDIEREREMWRERKKRRERERETYGLVQEREFLSGMRVNDLEKKTKTK